MKATQFLAIAAVATLLAAPAQAITWGEPDGGTNPQVGTLLFVQNGVGFLSCTGTLIAPRVLLTAGHCVAARDANGVMQPNNLTFVRFEDNALEGIQDYPGNLGGWLANEWLAVERVMGKKSFYAALPRSLRVATTFAIVRLAWVFFRASSLREAAEIISRAVVGLPTSIFMVMRGEQIDKLILLDKTPGAVDIPCPRVA